MKGGGLTTVDHGDSDISGVDGRKEVFTVGQAENKSSSILYASSSILSQFSNRKYRATPPLYTFHIKSKDIWS